MTRPEERRNIEQIHAKIRTQLQCLVCRECGELFGTGMFGERAITGDEAMIAAHACGWDVSLPDVAYCPDCKRK